MNKVTPLLSPEQLAVAEARGKAAVAKALAAQTPTTVPAPPPDVRPT